MKRIFPAFFLLLNVVLFADESWETAIAGILTSPPAEDLDGRIFCTAEDRALHALDGITGREFWNFRPGRKLIDFTIVSPDGTIFILTSQYDLVAVSPGGWERWRYRLDSPPAISPAVDYHGIFYAITQQNVLISFDRSGNLSILNNLEETYSGIYTYHDYVLLQKERGFDIFAINGSYLGSVSASPNKILILENGFWCQSIDGHWCRIEPESFSVIIDDAPLREDLIYPKKDVLITDDARIVSGRKDWFMEAYKQGTESYDSRYQSGCNSSRTNSLRSLPDPSTREGLRGFDSISYLFQESKYLNALLREYEQISTFHMLLLEHPYYDLQLMDLISSSEILASSKGENPPNIDSHSLYRMYGVLSRWGDIQTRESLIRLCQLERDTTNLQTLFAGLANIGVDPDGKSLTIIFQSIRENRGNEDLYQSALQFGLEIAQYNGGKSMKDFLELLRYITDRSRSGKTSDMIKDIMQELSH